MPRYTPKQIEQFVEMWNQTETTEELAKKLKRTVKACKSLAISLRKRGYSLKYRPGSAVYHDEHDEEEDKNRAPPRIPAVYRPGSKAKIQVLMRRVASGEQLWHPKDTKVNQL
jgi:hypothetical protein